MPIVTVEWIEGRSAEQKLAVAERITAAVAEIGDTDPSSVWLFRDVPAQDWVIGGSPTGRDEGSAGASTGVGR